MSIQSEIDRISGNVNNALSAIADKGVSVPSGANSDDLAELIGQVETGVDTSDATASASEILSGETAYVNGEKVTGIMANRGAVSQSLDTSTTDYTVPAGYHNGSGTVSITTEEKTVTPSSSVQTITPSSGKVLSKVTINASTGIDTSDATAAAGDILSGKSAYVKGSKVTGTIDTKTSSDLTASGAKVSVPAGYYASTASRSVATATQAAPSITVSTDGLITASATQTAGYVSAGTKSDTKQLTTQAAKTVTPSSSLQTAVASGVYTTGEVTVAAVPTQTKTATPSAAAQTIKPSSGKFLSSVTVNAIPSSFIQLPDNISQLITADFTLTEAASDIRISIADTPLQDMCALMMVYTELKNVSSLSDTDVASVIDYGMKGGVACKKKTSDDGIKKITDGLTPYVWRVNKTTIGANTYSDNYKFAANIPYKLVCVRIEGLI